MATSSSDMNDIEMSNEDGLIFTAIMNNDKRYLIELLIQGCSPMGDDSSSEVATPLELAINLQNLDMVRILLRYGACMRSTIRTLNSTALHCAVLNRQKSIIIELLENKVDWRATDGNGATVLHMVFELEETTIEDDDEMSKPKIPKMDFSLEQEIIEIITIFLNLGTDVNAEINTGETPLFLALKKGMIEVAGFLIERGANVHVRDNLGNSLIHLLINDEVEEPNPDDIEDVEPFVQKNNATFVNWLLTKGVNANYKNASGEIPIQLAIDYKLRDTLLVLMKHINVHYINDEGETWLHVFFKMFQGVDSSKDEFLTISEIHDIVKDLISKGTPVNVVDCYGQTLFHSAIQLKNTKILKMIAERFVNAQACNSEGETVLHALISRCIDDERQNEEEYAEIARILTSKGADPNKKDKRGMSSVHVAAQYKYAKIVALFKESGADLKACTDDGDSILHIVGGKLSNVTDELADKSLVEMSLEQGCDVNHVKSKGGWSPLHIAASSGNIQVAKSLLEHGAKVDCRNEDQYSPLHMAAMKDSQEMIELLAKNGADANGLSKDSSTPLHLATKSAALKVIKSLVEHGADVHYCSREFSTPLHLAALGDCRRSLELLVQSGADVNAPNRDGATPLHWACNFSDDNLPVIERLVELGADVNRKDRREQLTAMHIAVRRKRPKQLFRLLARHGANVDAQQASGDTPLHEAARNCRLDDYAIPTLLELGARTEITNSSGLTPLHCAVVCHCSDGLYLLLKFGVSINNIPKSIRLLMMADREMNKYAVSHLSKLQAANLPIDKHYEACTTRLSSTRASSSSSSDLPVFLDLGHSHEKYKQEVEGLKACFLDDQVSFYHLLHMESNSRFSYLKNKSLDLSEVESKFPSYYGFIWRICFEAKERKLLMDPAKWALQQLGKANLPEICADCIFNFLNNECLKNMIEAAKNS